MGFKRILAVGVTLILVVVALTVMMYFFNEELECAKGAFLCHNTTKCVLQRNWCDGVYDCPYKDDEDSEECFDGHGDWGYFVKERNFVKADHKECDTPEITLNCTYYKCHVTCTHRREIPQSLSLHITKMIIVNSSLGRLKSNHLRRYSELRILTMEQCNITNLVSGFFANQKKLSFLNLSKNLITAILPGYFTGLTSLETLNLKRNKITIANLIDLKNSLTLDLINLSQNLIVSKDFYLPALPGLRELILDENRFHEITNELFEQTPNLISLSLENNLIEIIDSSAFINLTKLVELNLSYNRIVTLPPDIFINLGSLRILLIGYNPIEDLQLAMFFPLKNLSSLGMEEIDIDHLRKNAFDSFARLDFVYFKKFHYCMTYARNVKKCKPISDGVSSLSHLLNKPLLRAAIWIISSVTIMGNALVLWGRLTAQDESRILSFIIRNLAASDMLMGLYLFIIAVQDIRFRDNYRHFASVWITSWPCTFLGILAMTSSVVSVAILSFISVERFIMIAAPLKCHHSLTNQTATMSMIVIWACGIFIAFFPAIHWRRSTRYYGVNGMCFPLHIDDPYLIGWEYSAIIFLGFNLIGLVTIIYVYVGMFLSIWKTRHATPLALKESEFILRFFLIVLTDAACWVPIIMLKILAMAKYPIPGDLHAWVVICILPVNSAVNPLLYTFTTPKFIERVSNGWFYKMRQYMKEFRVLRRNM